MMSSAHHESTARGPDGRLVDRMLFFSDAVFAIVLTIMVLELHAPLLEAKGSAQAQSAAALWDTLGDMWQTFFAYLLSFAIVSMWWAFHMRVTRALHHFDWATAVANLTFILSVTLIPFAASLLGENMGNPAAWSFYWGVNAASAFTLTAMMAVVTRGGGRLIGGITPRQRTGRLIQAAGPGFAFTLGAYMACAGYFDLSHWCWVLIFPMSILARLVTGKTHPHVEAEA
jgi:uncharacterized membrane protein